VHVDWPAWPKALTTSDDSLAACVEQWRNEFTTNVIAEPWIAPTPQVPATDMSGDEAWSKFMAEWLERYELADY